MGIAHMYQRMSNIRAEDAAEASTALGLLASQPGVDLPTGYDGANAPDFSQFVMQILGPDSTMDEKTIAELFVAATALNPEYVNELICSSCDLFDRVDIHAVRRAGLILGVLGALTFALKTPDFSVGIWNDAEVYVVHLVCEDCFTISAAQYSGFYGRDNGAKKRLGRYIDFAVREFYEAWEEWDNVAWSLKFSRLMQECCVRMYSEGSDYSCDASVITLGEMVVNELLYEGLSHISVRRRMEWLFAPPHWIRS